MIPGQFSIWIVTLPGHIHTRCFEEVALGLQSAFAELGFDVPIVTDPALIRGRAVVLGTNLLCTVPRENLPPNLILYNLEQVTKESVWMNPENLELLRRYPVWDYSLLNIEKFRELGITNLTLCGIGYMPALSRIPLAAQDIDIAFVGSPSPRRNAILQKLAAQGKKVAAEFGIYGRERDAIFARAKIVLNLHYYEAQIFEIVRVSYLLANRKCVVSEVGKDAALEARLREGIAFVPYDGILDACGRLLENAAGREAIAERGFKCFSAMSQTAMLKRAMASLPSPV